MGGYALRMSMYPLREIKYFKKISHFLRQSQKVAEKKKEEKATRHENRKSKFFKPHEFSISNFIVKLWQETMSSVNGINLTISTEKVAVLRIKSLHVGLFFKNCNRPLWHKVKTFQTFFLLCVDVESNPSLVSWD